MSKKCAHKPSLTTSAWWKSGYTWYWWLCLLFFGTPWTTALHTHTATRTLVSGRPDILHAKKKKKDNRGKKKNSNKLRSSKWVLWYPLSCSRCARLRWLQRRVYKGWPRSCDSACWQTGGGSERVFKCGGCWHPLLQRTKNNTSGKRTRMYKFSSCAKNNNNKKQEKHGKKKRTINSVWKPFFSQGE